jgi:phosphoenolpyruvate synthase/pyruvate phosphate dikinase
MKTRDEVIGSVVERVIPEGWSVLLGARIADGDAVEGPSMWTEAACACGDLTGVDGRWHGLLVIRRNTPEPSVESLKKDRDECPSCQDLAKLRAQIVEMKSDLAASFAEREVLCKALDAKDAEIERLKADVHMWAEANQANLARADAADNKMCVGFQDEVDRLKARVEDLEKERCEWIARYNAKVAIVNALHKALEGA